MSRAGKRRPVGASVLGSLERDWFLLSCIAIVEVAAEMGFKHIRLTGGEPLVRKGVVDCVRHIVETPGIERVAMTTNGILLPQMAKDLRAAGLSRVNVSLRVMLENEKWSSHGTREIWIDGSHCPATFGVSINSALVVAEREQRISALHAYVCA